MKKSPYVPAEIEVLSLSVEDILTASDENLLPPDFD